jgi:hypothetical protein
LPSVAGLVCAVAVGVATISGRGLRWYALALWEVTVNSNLRGVCTAAFDPVVRFVITSKGEVSTDSYRRQVVGHLLGSFALLVAGGLLSWTATRSDVAPRTARQAARRLPHERVSDSNTR